MKNPRHFWIGAFLVIIAVAAIGIAIFNPSLFSGRLNRASIFTLPQTSFGSAPNFAVLAATMATSSPRDTLISGDVGVSPGTITSGVTITNGTTYTGNNPVVIQARTDLAVAYDQAIAAGPVPASHEIGNTNLDGMTLTPGVYHSNNTLNLAANGTLTLDATPRARGGTSGSFIFQADKGINISSGSRIVLINTTACDVFWQSDNSASIGPDVLFSGTVMAQDDIILGSGPGLGSTIFGRVLSKNGSVTMDNARIVAPDCNQSASAPANLTVVKLVEGGGDSSEFTINVSGTNVSLPSFLGDSGGTPVTLDAGTYAVSEVPDDDYTVAYDNCSGIIAAGETKVCTITNTRKPTNSSSSLSGQTTITTNPPVTPTSPNPTTPNNAAPTPIRLPSTGFPPQ